MSLVREKLRLQVRSSSADTRHDSWKAHPKVKVDDVFPKGDQNGHPRYDQANHEVVFDKENNTWISTPIFGTERPETSLNQFVASTLGLTATIPAVLALLYAGIEINIISRQYEYKFNWQGMAMWAYLVLDSLLLPIINIPHTLVKYSTFFGKWRQQIRLVGPIVPRVDVIITVCREELSVVSDTILATTAIDYPRDRFRVIVSDDGDSSELRSWINRLDKEGLYYTSRIERSGFKGGNLNHAVDMAKKLPGGPAEFIAALDADMIPEKRWLRSLAGHLLLDNKMGLVCPTQSFYNVPANDPLDQSNHASRVGHHLIQDLAGLGLNTGSGYMIRREALESIGGFPTECLVEDIQSSMEMMAKGWRTAYLGEKLQFGLVPETYHAHLKQFVRWWTGNCQLGFSFGFYFSKKRTGLLNATQRFLGFSYAVTTLFLPLITFAKTLGLPFRLWHGVPLVFYDSSEEMRMLLRLQCVITFTKWLHEVHFSTLVGYRVAVRETATNFWMSQYYVLECMRVFVLPSWLGGSAPGFTSTGSIATTLDERTPSGRAPFWARFRRNVCECGVWFHIVFLIVMCPLVIGRFYTVSKKSELAHLSYESSYSERLRYILWPSPVLFITMLSYTTPIVYILFPPTVAERHELLGKRFGDGERYASQPMNQGPKSPWFVDYPFLYALFILYSLGIFVATWRV